MRELSTHEPTWTTGGIPTASHTSRRPAPAWSMNSGRRYPNLAAAVAAMRPPAPMRFSASARRTEASAVAETLRDAVFRALDVVRVYSKSPKAKEADFERPFTVKRGGTVLDVAELIHKEVAASFKFARVWGHGVHDGTPVKGDHEVHDKDIVEIHS